MTSADGRASLGDRETWLLAAAIVVGVADWVISWLLIGETGEGTRTVAGLSEGNLRAMQNPGTLLFLAVAAVVLRRSWARVSDAARAGLVISSVALALTLVGNVVEFGIWGDGPLDSQDPGAALYFSGLYVLMLGLLLLVVGGALAGWRHRRRAGAG